VPNDEIIDKVSLSNFYAFRPFDRQVLAGVDVPMDAKKKHGNTNNVSLIVYILTHEQIEQHSTYFLCERIHRN